MNNAGLSSRDRAQGLLDLHRAEVERVQREMDEHQRKVWDDRAAGWRDELTSLLHCVSQQSWARERASVDAHLQRRSYPPLGPVDIIAMRGLRREVEGRRKARVGLSVVEITLADVNEANTHLHEVLYGQIKHLLEPVIRKSTPAEWTRIPVRDDRTDARRPAHVH
jgi:hypothetical protein